jgi:spore coat polysaccharide biosynthesis predicted glycosyltransferase SpsG
MLGFYQHLKKDAQKVVYFTDDDFIPLESVDILHHASNNINDSITFLQQYGIKVLIVDNYEISEEQIYLLNNNFHLIVFDAGFNNYKIEAIINFNPFSVQMYPQKHAKTNYFLGLEYMFYRDSITNIKKIDEEINSVFICIGGSDVNEITYKLIPLLSHVFSYHIVLGKGCSTKYYKKVKNYLMQKGLNFVLYHQPDDFFHILAKCQFAITSCSTTIYELFYFNKPFICINVIENQDTLTRYLEKQDITIFTRKSVHSLKGVMSKNLFKRLKLPKNSSRNEKLLNYVKDLI